MRTLILSTFPYACESWSLIADIERRIQALEMRCYRRLLNISYKDHVTNEEIRNRIQNAIGVHDDLLTMVKKRKLRWYGHISRSSGMAKTILQGTVKGARRRRRRKRNSYLNHATQLPSNQINQPLRLSYLSHRRPAKAQASNQHI